MIAFYHGKDFDMLKLVCISPNLANICLHKPTDTKLYPFTEGDKDFLEKIREDVVGDPSIVFTRKAVVDEIFVRKSTNICKSIFGIDTSQLYSYLMCQPMPTGLYTRRGLGRETSRFTPQQNGTRSFENMVIIYFIKKEPIVKLEAYMQQADRKKLTAVALMVVDSIATLHLKPWAALISFPLVQRFGRLSLRRILNVVVRRESWMN